MNTTYLIGFSGVGKSTVAKRFAETNDHSNYKYEDVNDWIIDSYNDLKYIPVNNMKDVLKHMNMGYVTDQKYKSYESNTFACGLEFDLKKDNKYIIATSATTPLYCKIPKKSLVVFLKSTFGEILDNLSHNEIIARPIFNDMNKARELFVECNRKYKEIADITIDTAYLSIDDIVELISLKKILFEKGDL